MYLSFTSVSLYETILIGGEIEGSINAQPSLVFASFLLNQINNHKNCDKKEGYWKGTKPVRRLKSFRKDSVSDHVYAESF